MKVVQTRLLFWAEAMAVNPGLILIRPERAGDHALLAHERTHCEQQRRIGTFRFWWCYLTDPGFRLHSELEAYRVQLALRPGALDGIAKQLATSYYLEITTEQVKALLLEPA